MALLSRDDILAADDIATDTVEVPRWAGTVTIAEMSGTAREAYEEMMYDKQGKLTDGCLRARLVAASVVDDKGELMFSVKDVDALAKKSAESLNRVYLAALKLNGLHATAKKDAAKNS